MTRTGVLQGLDSATGDTFGEKSLHQRVPGGASGHETDKMSAHSPAGTKLLARGLNPESGGAEIVHFTCDSGGEVFSVGSICWNASILVDDAVSQITKNVIIRNNSLWLKYHIVVQWKSSSMGRGHIGCGQGT